MKTEIVSRKKLAKLLEASPNKHNAILIFEDSAQAECLELSEMCLNSLCLGFNDYTNETRADSPRKEQVQAALDWAARYEFVYVSCYAGVSRSAATAFLIECLSSPASEAIKVLNPQIHFPNELILKYGVDILGPHLIEPISEFFRETADFKGWRLDQTTKFFKG